MSWPDVNSDIFNLHLEVIQLVISANPIWIGNAVHSGQIWTTSKPTMVWNMIEFIWYVNVKKA